MSASDARRIVATRPTIPKTSREIGFGEHPTLANWLTAPFNRRSFRRGRELFPSERVGAGDSVLLGDGPGLQIDTVLADYLRRSYTDALVVLHRGRLAGEWYGQGVEADQRHVLFSVSKSVVGLTASALLAEGVLDETATVASYLPELAHGGYGAATVRDVLNMTANIGFVEDYDGPDLRQYREASGQLPTAESKGIRPFVAGLPATGAHGQAFKYISPTTDIAGWICERASGRSLAELITSYVWQPMGAEFDADLLLDRFGTARASGGLCGTARDMARIGQLLLDGSAEGAVGGAARAASDVMLAGDPAAWAAGSLSDFLEGAAYRDFWYQPRPAVFLAAGIYGQRIYVDVPRSVVVAQQASLPATFDPETWSETLPTFERIAQAVAGTLDTQLTDR